MHFDTGRLIAYGGGTGVSATSLASKASTASLAITPDPTKVVSVLNYPLFQAGGVQLVTADLVSIGGMALVASRLLFDIWKHLDERRRDTGGR